MIDFSPFKKLPVNLGAAPGCANVSSVGDAVERAVDDRRNPPESLGTIPG